MTILKKLFTALKGGAREAGEAIVDANSIRIFEQEIRDAEHQLEKAKSDLTEVIAKEMQTARKVDSLVRDINKHETYTKQALDKNDEELALKIAEKISEFQNELEIQKDAQSKFAAHAQRLKSMIKKTTAVLSDLQRQLVMVKTTESVQKATKAITSNYASGSSKLLTAKESLDRIKKKQQDLDDRITAGETLDADLNGENLEERMKEAGIIQDDNKAQEILDRLRSENK
ncbi:MAG: PspA/IM30 family protein [Candidatus Margulisiibacteriota bacterium]|nr:PspA/IM30 family protein [Candidatus Margulisiibacteriota bacterium]